MAATLQFDLPGFTTKGQQLFKKLSSRRVGDLNRRMRKKGFAGNLPLAIGRQILAAGVGRPCKYCHNPVKISEMSLDHPMPISKGGDPWTVECIDIGCNHEKGTMDSEEFARFCVHVKTYAPETQAYIHGMMKAGAAYQRVLAISRGKFMKKKQKGNQDGQTDEPAHIE